MNEPKLTRRIFLMGSLAAAAGCATGTKGKRAAKRRTVSPNEKLNVAGIGIGGQGGGDISACGTENVVALCDVDWGYDGTQKTFAHFPKATQYKDFRVMLEKEKSIDAVTISTPDHMHAFIALTAMQMGKHVYVQKPMTHNIEEARMLTLAARKYKVATQMGNQGHSSDDVRQICEWIDAGAIGAVREAHTWTNRPSWPQGLKRPAGSDPVPSTLDWDLWLGVAPERPYVANHPATGKNCYLPFVWRGWWDFGCGALGDMACHVMDASNWALKLGYPTSVEAVSQEGATDEQAPLKSVIKYEFPKRGAMPPVTLYWHDGGNLPERPKDIPADVKLGSGDNGTLFVGEKGYITCRTYSGEPRLLPADRFKDYKSPAQTLPRIPNQNHYQDWIAACKGGAPACSNFDYAGPFTEVVLLGNLALRTGKKLEWDGPNMKVTNLPEANSLVKNNYRKGWSISEQKVEQVTAPSHREKHRVDLERGVENAQR
ncbi:MAG: Gfo/Idh/MocA family oxidoreductase [Candidatus Hydrogenedentes bacterium]|nr:Gfo/Idh/MocA family oxidoreductase [Candidatus Hydrogenedentota bacterium]